MNLQDWCAREQRTLGFVALGVVVLASASGNILLKIGARPAAADTLLFGLVAWQTIAGIASFGCGVLAYAWALRSIDVHVAQSVISVQYVTVILLAALLLGERIPSQQWWGMGLITAGLVLCMR